VTEDCRKSRDRHRDSRGFAETFVGFFEGHNTCAL